MMHERKQVMGKENARRALIPWMMRVLSTYVFENLLWPSLGSSQIYALPLSQSRPFLVQHLHKRNIPFFLTCRFETIILLRREFEKKKKNKRAANILLRHSCALVTFFAELSSFRFDSETNLPSY